jgi:hypothetical protein
MLIVLQHEVSMVSRTLNLQLASHVFQHLQEALAIALHHDACAWITASFRLSSRHHISAV